MIDYNNINSIIINKNKKMVMLDDPDQLSSIIYFGRRYESINDLFKKDQLFNFKPIKGYILDFNIYEKFSDSAFYESIFKKILYKNRFINNKPVMDMLKDMKLKNKYIRNISITSPKFNTSFINNTSLHNEHFFDEFYKLKNITLKKEIAIFEEYINRYISSLEYENYNKIIMIPVEDWIQQDQDVDYRQNLNPISYLLYIIFRKIENPFKKDVDIIITKGNDFIKFNTSVLNDKSLKNKLRLNILRLTTNKKYDDIIDSDDTETADDDVIEVETVEPVTYVSLNDDDLDDITKNINSIAETIIATSNDRDQLTTKQQKFIEENDRKVRDIKINNISVGTIIDNKNDELLTTTDLKIDSVNEVWKNMTYNSFDKLYVLEKDIVKVFNFFGNINKAELIMTDISVEDTSTYLDYKYTWTVQYRNMKTATLFTIKVDMPKIIDNSFMYLGGNNKILGKQLFRRPLGKSNRFEVQMVSNYNKIFVGLSKDNLALRSSSNVYRLTKTLFDPDLKNISIVRGNNTISNNRFNMDVERYDIGTEISEINYKDYKFIFNMEELNGDNEILGYKGDEKILFEGNPVDKIIEILSKDEQFKTIFENCKDSTNYAFSKAKLMAENFPIMYLVCYYKGFQKGLQIADIEYEIVSKKSRNDYGYRYIKTKDFYIRYKDTTRNSILMSGLVHCGIENFEVQELENHNNWIDMLEMMGYSRMKADGLDNFNLLFLDPITREVCDHYGLEQDFSKLLIRASDLLLDTEFMEHGDVRNYRLRSIEQLAGYLYAGLSSEYEKFRVLLKKTGKGKILIKQNKIILMIMSDKMFTDTSDINDLHSFEMAQTSSVKGLRGMNESRSFNLDKRSYSKSMNGIITGTTAFAGNVGMERQVALNCKVNSTRGYLDDIKHVEDNDLDVGCLSMVDATIPLSSYSDDPFRQLMGALQNNKHRVMVKESKPALITTGADKALPHLTRNLFSIKASDDGIVSEVSDTYVIISYNNGEKEFINTEPFTVKDSGGGMFLELHYEVPLKEGQKIKAHDIIAYDKKSYTNIDGEIIYNAGTIVKVALLNTEEGFEDSSVCSDRLSEKLSTVIIKVKDVKLNKDCIIHHIAKVGDTIKDGEPLLIYQNAFETEETNALLTKLNGSGIVNDLGKITVKSKYTGYIQDIRVYRTCELDEMSESCRKYFNKINKPHIDRLNVIKKNKIKDAELKFNFLEKQELTGKLKGAYDSLLFEFHIRTINKFSNGDKLVLYTANKGVNATIFEKGKEPTSEFRPDEIIDTLGTLSAINKRKVTSVPKTALLNKILIETTRTCRDMLNIDYDVNDI